MSDLSHCTKIGWARLKSRHQKTLCLRNLTWGSTDYLRRIGRYDISQVVIFASYCHLYVEEIKLLGKGKSIFELALYTEVLAILSKTQQGLRTVWMFPWKPSKRYCCNTDHPWKMAMIFYFIFMRSFWCGNSRDHDITIPLDKWAGRDNAAFFRSCKGSQNLNVEVHFERQIKTWSHMVKNATVYPYVQSAITLVVQIAVTSDKSKLIQIDDNFAKLFIVRKVLAEQK